MKVLLYVLRSNLEIIGVVDTWISLIWKTARTKAGNFELYVPATPKYRQLLLANNFIARSDDRSFMYITTVREKSEDDGTKIIVSGYSAEGIFRKRLYPGAYGHKWLDKNGPKNIEEVLAAMSPLGFNCNYATLTGTPLIDIPSEYLNGNMEDYLRYILGRTQTEETDEEGNPYNWIKTTPETYHLYLSKSSWYSGPNGEIEAILYVDTIYGDLIVSGKSPDGVITYKPYMPFPPVCMFSEDIGNISNLQYTYSEEDCFSAIFAVINQNFSETVTEKNLKLDTSTGEEYEEEASRNIGFEDLDIIVDEAGDPVLPKGYVSIADSRLGQTEKVISVDPVVKPWTRPSDFVAWKEYVGQAVPKDVPTGTKTYAAEGIGIQRHTRYNPQYTYQIDASATITRMRNEINKAILKSTENFQGTVNISYEQYKNGYGQGPLFKLGDIVVIRDNNRLKDYYKRVEEIEESFDRNGYKITPTFGEPIKTIWDMI